MINNVGIPSSELQTSFGVLPIDTENSAAGDRSAPKLMHKIFIIQKEVDSALVHLDQ